jgi:copper(I)-binding protein
VAGTSLEVDAVNRALRAAAMGVLLLSPVALAACSAGQVTQTASQQQNLGNSADVGQLHLRALELPYPTGGAYAQGTDARLLGAIASSASSEDTLVSIEGDFESVEVVDPSATASATAGTAPSSLALTVPAGGTLFIGNGTGPSITLVGLTKDVGVGQYVSVTFTFEQAGAVTVAVPVGTSARDLPRGESFDFHGHEGSTEAEGGA